MINPFENISEIQKNRLFNLLQVHIYSYKKNQEILPKAKAEDIICILLEGSANIISIDYEGEEHLIEELIPNSVFGTYISSINNNEYQILAKEDSKVVVIDYNKFDEKNISYSYYNVFVNNLFSIVNEKLKDKNDRIRILTKKSIRDKLLEYFAIEYEKNHSRIIYLPSSFKDLADYFAVNRSAMFREIRSMKDENFIKVDGKKITLLYNPMQ